MGTPTVSFGLLLIIGAAIALAILIGVIVAIVLVASNRGRDERDH